MIAAWLIKSGQTTSNGNSKAAHQSCVVLDHRARQLGKERGMLRGAQRDKQCISSRRAVDRWL